MERKTLAEETRSQRAREEVRVRDGGERPTLAVRHGTRIRPGTLRTDPQGATRVEPREAPATRPDGFDVQDREGDWEWVDQGLGVPRGCTGHNARKISPGRA